jgi:hypothetical protein
MRAIRKRNSLPHVGVSVMIEQKLFLGRLFSRVSTVAYRQMNSRAALMPTPTLNNSDRTFSCGRRLAKRSCARRWEGASGERIVEHHLIRPRRDVMDNKHPKSEIPALKEAAATAKDKQGLDKSKLMVRAH